MTCGSCGQDNRDGARFCDNCGSRLEAAAPEGPATPAYAPPAALAEKIRRAGASLEGERKHVTVLFADVSGSMDLAEQVDPEAWRRIMDGFYNVLCDGVHRFEGTVVQFTGDGVMALFGAPIAHEDHAIRAAHAALHLRRALATHAADLRRQEGLNFSVRLGLNSGEVVAGAIGDDLRVDFTAIGHTVGLAKRMEALAEPGTAYLTGHTARHLDGFFALRDLGPFDVKGVREQVQVFELTGTGRVRTRLDRARDRGFSRFVGRDRELGVLDEALEDALAGRGSIVGVVGEPGVGKSRLCHEFADRARARGIPVFHASGQAHARNLPFHVALEMLRGYFGIDDSTTAQETRERVAGRLLLLDESFAEDLPVVFEFLGVPDPERPAPRMDPEARMRHLKDAARRLVRGHADREAAVNLVEDLHWVDDPSREFLETLAEAVPGHRGLLVVNFRPEFQADWQSVPAYRQIELVPLGPQAVSELVRDLVGEDPSLDGFADEMVTRTGGNPFFVEELIQALVEDGTLAGPRGRRRLARSLGAISVPEGVHGVLAARIDRLPEEEKTILQAASVVGREFAAPVLERVAGAGDGALGAALVHLVEAGFLVEGAGDDDYAFRHPLTQEVAYTSQLAERRRQLHAAAARAMIELGGDRLDERAALVAEHWQAAEDLLEAARWHARAGWWTGTRDPAQAGHHWREVRRLCGRLPADAETTGLALGASQWLLQSAWRVGIDRAEVEAIHADGVALAEAAGDEVMAALITTTWASTIGISEAMNRALAPVEETYRTVHRAGRTDAEVPVLAFLSYARMISGDYPGAIAALERGIELTRENRGLGAGIAIADPYAWFLMMRGFVETTTGHIPTGLATIAQALDCAAASGDRETQGWAHMNHPLPAYFGADVPDMGEHAARSLDLAEAIGSPFSRIWARYNLGVAHVVAGRPGAAADILRDALALVERHGTARENEPWTRAMLCEALIEAGDPEAGRAEAELGLEQATQRGVVNSLPAIHGTLGRAHLALGDAGSARRWLERAVGGLETQGTPCTEPRMRRTLARALEALGEPEAAAAQLRLARAVAERTGAAAVLRELDAEPALPLLPEA